MKRSELAVLSRHNVLESVYIAQLDLEALEGVARDLEIENQPHDKNKYVIYVHTISPDLGRKLSKSYMLDDDEKFIRLFDSVDQAIEQLRESKCSLYPVVQYIA
ncbi:hypothetical protein [Acinetobacter sp. P1(2025)]|uniref:hypothetical protein n=1 Tax=Acinetobacter sp. P1(2025) TaxID=3446120 RepID=UPI003F53CFDC